MNSLLFVKEPEKRVCSLVRKLTHSGETELNQELIKELRAICKDSPDSILIATHKECFRCLRKEHAQVRVATVKLIDYLFQKSHVIRLRLLDDFDTFLELTLAITQRPKVKLKLPPPKRFAALLQELTAKMINSWHVEYGCGYEKLRYVYKYLREHQLVDFSAFRVQNHEQIIKRQELAKRQERILDRSIENRIREYRSIKPEIEQLIAQIESSIEILLPTTDEFNLNSDHRVEAEESQGPYEDELHQRQHGIANLSQGIEIEFSPYMSIIKDKSNKDVVKNLQEFKRELVSSKLPKLVAIEKLLVKRSEQFVGTIKQIIDLKSKATAMIMKLSELNIIGPGESSGSKSANTLDNVDSESDEDIDFEDVQPKEGLETYIPKSMRSEYGLEAIDPRELDETRHISLTDESFTSTSSSTSKRDNLGPTLTCNVLMESGKLCPRQDKIKCPFHGKIIPRDHLGQPLNEDDKAELERKDAAGKRKSVPDWQDPALLRDIRAATGVDLTMPSRAGPKSRLVVEKKLADAKTCDLTPKQRLEKRLKKLSRQ